MMGRYWCRAMRAKVWLKSQSELVADMVCAVRDRSRRRGAKKDVNEELELSSEQRCQQKKRIENQASPHVGSRIDSGDHRENRSCQSMECLPCREAGKVAGIEVAEGRFSRPAGLRWRSFGFRRADRGREGNSS